MDDPEDLDRFFRLAQEKEVGVIAMKVVARGALIERGLGIRQLLPYVLSYPVSTAVVGISDVGSLGFRRVTASESPTCWGRGAINLNKLRTPASYPCQLPKTPDVSHLEENVRIASTFEQLSEEEMAEIRALAQS